MSSTKFDHIVRQTRAAQNMTLDQFGDALGVSHQAVDQWERGGNISEERLSNWCRDERQWVSIMGAQIIAIKYGAVLQAAAKTVAAALTPETSNAQA